MSIKRTGTRSTISHERMLLRSPAAIGDGSLSHKLLPCGRDVHGKKSGDRISGFARVAGGLGRVVFEFEAIAVESARVRRATARLRLAVYWQAELVH